MPTNAVAFADRWRDKSRSRRQRSNASRQLFRFAFPRYSKDRRSQKQDQPNQARGGEQDAACAALPLTDTVKRVDAGGFVRESPDREGLRVVQSPWMGRPGATTAHLVPGDPLAFAVRTEWDLELAEHLR